jgi:outer membrane lipase/esterase
MQTLSFKTLFASGTVALALLSGVPAAAFDGLVILGDSLSDSGNNYLALNLQTTPNSAITSNGYIPTYPYTSTVYSNGPVWASSFATAFGLSAAPSLAGGSNFAFGGAETSFQSPSTAPSLTTQMGMFLGASGGMAPSNFLYVVAGGGNNARTALADIAANPANTFAIIGAASYQYAADIGSIVDTLQAAGAQHVVVWNAPNLGVAPAVLAMGPQAAALASGVSQAMNGALNVRLSGEVGVTTFDLFGLVGQVVANPPAYGLDNVTDACIAGACDASKYLFWDGIHPTAKGHELISAAMVAAVIPEPQTYALFAAGLFMLGWRLRRR